MGGVTEPLGAFLLAEGEGVRDTRAGEDLASSPPLLPGRRWP